MWAPACKAAGSASPCCRTSLLWGRQFFSNRSEEHTSELPSLMHTLFPVPTLFRSINPGGVALGFSSGGLAGMVLAGFFAWLTVWLGSNQVATGLALSLFGVGASAYIGIDYVGASLQGGRFGIPLLQDIPFVGPAVFQQHPVVYLSLLLRSEEHTSELQSLMRISYAVFCLKKKNDTNHNIQLTDNNLSGRAILTQNEKLLVKTPIKR